MYIMYIYVNALEDVRSVEDKYLIINLAYDLESNFPSILF